MSTMQYITLFLHLLAAVTWIGGAIFLAMVDPLLRGLDPAANGPFIRAVARRFKVASWHSAALLVVTGLGNLYFAQAFDHFGEYMRARPAMHWKLTLVILMIVVKYVQDFVTGPRAAKEMEALGPGKDLPRSARITATLSRVNLMFGIAVLYCAILLRT